MKKTKIVEVEEIICDVCGELCGNHTVTRQKNGKEFHACDRYDTDKEKTHAEILREMLYSGELPNKQFVKEGEDESLKPFVTHVQNSCMQLAEVMEDEKQNKEIKSLLKRLQEMRKERVNKNIVVIPYLEDIDKIIEIIQGVIKKETGVKDRNGKMICFGDTVRFANKAEWYGGEYSAKVAFGIMTKQEALEEIETLPYEQRIVNDVKDYEWLLSSEIQEHWEVVEIPDNTIKQDGE